MTYAAGSLQLLLIEAQLKDYAVSLMASMLIYNHVDPVSVSKRLGHSQVSTTTDIYAHVIEEADKQNSDILAGIFLKNA